MSVVAKNEECLLQEQFTKTQEYLYYWNSQRGEIDWDLDFFGCPIGQITWIEGNIGFWLGIYVILGLAASFIRCLCQRFLYEDMLYQGRKRRERDFP